MHQEHDWVARRLRPALSQMRIHDRLPGDGATVEQPVAAWAPAIEPSCRGRLASGALVRSPSDRRHGAHEAIGSSGITQLGRPKLGFGPMRRVIQHSRPLAPLPAGAGSVSFMRI